MKCPHCGHEYRQTAKFCEECGTRLSAEQPAAILTTPQPTTHYTTDPERKVVTALFSDLTGYTALAERLDPEQVKEITGEIFAGVRAITAKYEGFIDRLLGDGVLVLFGVPKAHEDDAARAVQAAGEIHEFVRGLNQKYKPRIGTTKPSGASP